MPAFHDRLAYPILALAAVVAATPYPASGGDPASRTVCVMCADGAIADIIININVILFLPLGAGLAAYGWPVRRCILVGAAVSAGIEYAQLFVPGRDSSLADIVSNTAGTIVGLALVRTAAFWLVPPPRRAATLLTSRSPGDTLETTVRGRPGRYCLFANADRARDLGFGVASAWALLYHPEHLPNWIQTLLNLAWMSGLLCPAGFWARGLGVRAVGASVAAAGLIVTPLVAPVMPVTSADWVAASLGFLLGTLARSGSASGSR